jgi:hypothetical protein
MIDFVLKNKEWIFSGIGVTIIGAFVVIGKWLYTKSRNRATQGISSDASKLESQTPYPCGEYLDHPTAKEIDDQISALPPFQQNGAENNYVGLKIKWKAKVSLIFPGNGNTVRISCNDTSGYFRYIHIKVNLSEYPKFKSMSEKEEFWIYGEIAGMEASGFHINVHRIQFLT